MTNNTAEVDWVAVFSKHYPHVVKLDMPESYGIMKISIYDWLSAHVGRRGMQWEFPTGCTYVFRDHEHAVLFSLTWSGA